MRKEAFWLQKKCVTIGKETEWIETLENRNNTFLFGDLTTMQTILKDESTFWDENLYGKGYSSAQIVTHIQNNLV
tara:strand:+ start:112 stop:336 length:225 start_codon:yes stop_codon:yes gene_type:complete